MKKCLQNHNQLEFLVFLLLHWYLQDYFISESDSKVTRGRSVNCENVPVCTAVSRVTEQYPAEQLTFLSDYMMIGKKRRKKWKARTLLGFCVFSTVSPSHTHTIAKAISNTRRCSFIHNVGWNRMNMNVATQIVYHKQHVLILCVC